MLRFYGASVYWFHLLQTERNRTLIYRTMAYLSLHPNYILIVWDLLPRFYYFSFPLCPIDCDITIKNMFLIYA